MRIQKQDRFYGPVLQQIVEYPVFTEINRYTDKPGVYLINKYQLLLIKYAADGDQEWSFSFSPNDIELFFDYDCYVALNCGNDAICLLSQNDLFKVIDQHAQRMQTVKVSFSEGCSMRVTGSKANLNRSVPHNAFPGAMLGQVPPKQEPYAWPKFVKLTAYCQRPDIMFRSTDRLKDLADAFGPHVGNEDVTLYLGVATLDPEWKTWTEANVKAIEAQVRYDLAFDGYTVKVERLTSKAIPKSVPRQQRGSDEFLWKLTVRA